ncbi:MAG: FlgD immunoglobulin-like domain containing protein [Candidatus Edwardsbacteria bacterium]|nr:FlgD immunoglobulin-like domain containing protein [Candidatus Edwardsbacteria bacterium]
MDIAVQQPFWHIDTYSPIGAYAGHHWWCGTNDFAGAWNSSPGYGCGWVQMLYSPNFDLTTVTSDSIQLKFYHYYSVEAKTWNGDLGRYDDWDCVNLWGSLDDGGTWFILYPDSLFSEGGGASYYDLKWSYAWGYTGMVPDSVHVPGWGGSNGGWKQVAFDLSAYKGQTLKLRFAVASDPLEADEDGGPYHGAWYIDNIGIDTLSNGGTRASVFFDDAEGGNLGWVAGSKMPAYHWHKTAYRTNSPVNSWYCGDEATKKYTWGYSDAIVSPYINLEQVRNTEPCLVDFAIWPGLPDDGTDENTYFDSWSVDISDDSGQTWVGINDYIYIDDSQAWITQSLVGELNISDYIGKVIKIRIAVSTDGDENVGEGLYVDDFIIWGKTRDPLPSVNTVLLVDNDGNAVDLKDESWTKYMEASLANLGYRYSLATIGGNKVMPAGYLEQFPVVVWNLGANYDGRAGASYIALTPYDQENIKSYLDNGGKLWMSGQTYFGFSAPTPDTTVHPNLWSDYLHLAPENGWFGSTCYTGTGVASDPIGDGLYDSLLYDPINGGGAIWSTPGYGYGLTPDPAFSDAVGFLTDDGGNFIGIRYWDGTSGNYQMVYTSFPFEAVSSQLNRDTLASRIMHWLLPGTPEYMPPAVPTGLSATQQYDSVICTWNANSEPDLAGYNVYRALQVGLPVWVKIGTVATNYFVDKSITDGAIYHYAVTAFDDKLPVNESVLSSWFYLQVTSWKGVEGEPVASSPRYFSLGQNNPNPFSRSTNIQFALPAQSRTRLVVYNITGQQIKTLVDDNLNPGYHNITWNGSDQNGRAVANGIYFYRMEATGANGQKFAQTKRLNLVK